MPSMTLLAVCTGSAERLPGKSYRTGIFKHPVSMPVMIDREGLLGDAICNRKHHGGLDQAVYGLGSVDLDWWSYELGHTIEPGTFGENIVVAGVDSHAVSVGDRFAIGSVMLEVTSTRVPCATLAVRMDDPVFPRRFNAAGRPGFYCRVLAPGVVQAGDDVTFHPFAGARITMPELLAMSVRNLSEADRKRYLAAPIHQKLRTKLAGP